MKHFTNPGSRALLLSLIIFFISCDSSPESTAYSDREDGEALASFSPPAHASDPGEQTEERNPPPLERKLGIREGVIKKKGDFWIGFPGDPGSTAYLKLLVDTRVTVLAQKDAYYKVRYLNLTGFVEKAMVSIRKDKGAKPVPDIAGAGEKGSVARKDGAGGTEEEISSGTTTPCTGSINEEIFPGVSCGTYRSKVQEKVNTLENYITRILDKSELTRENAIDLACRLFVNEHAQVYTSGVNEPARSRPIRKYLNSLMALNYDKVEIEWTNIQYVSELRKGPDGRYFGFVHVEQQFRGFSDGRLVYGDITEKKITIILEAYEVVNASGESSTRWDVFLSDIGVEQTQSI